MEGTIISKEEVKRMEEEDKKLVADILEKAKKINFLYERLGEDIIPSLINDALGDEYDFESLNSILSIAINELKVDKWMLIGFLQSTKDWLYLGLIQDKIGTELRLQKR